MGLGGVAAPSIALLELPEGLEPGRLGTQGFLQVRYSLLRLPQLGPNPFLFVLCRHAAVGEILQDLFVILQGALEDNGLSREGLQALIAFVSLPFLLLDPAPEVFQTPGQVGCRIPEPGLFSSQIDEPGLLGLEPLLGGPLLATKGFTVSFRIGDGRPGPSDLFLQCGRGAGQTPLFLADGVKAAPVLLHLYLVTGLAVLEVCGLVPGKLDGLFLEVNSVFDGIELFLEAGAEGLLFQELRSDRLGGGLERLEEALLIGDPILQGLFLLLERGLLGMEPQVGVQGQGHLPLADGRLEVPILLGPLGLAGQGVQLALHLPQDIVEPQEVLFRRLHLADGSLFATPVLGNAGGLLDKLTPFLGFRLHKAGHAVLLHEGIGTGTHTGTQKELLDVQKTAGDLVDGIFTVAVPKKSSRNGNFCAVRVKARKGMTFGAGKDHDHLGHTDGGGVLGSVKDDVVHLLSPEGLHPLLSHDPAQGIHDIALAAPVGPDDGADTGGEIEDHLVPKRFEPRYFQTFQLHGYTLSPSKPASGPVVSPGHP